MQFDEQTVRMLKRVSRERDFIPFLEELSQSYTDNSLTQDGSPMYRTQGMALGLRELAKTIIHAANMP